MTKKRKSSQARFSARRGTRLAALFLVVAILALLVLELTNTIHIFHNQSVPPVIPTQSKPTNKSSSKSSSSGNPANSSTSSSKSTLPSGAGSDVQLIAPFGDFVSNHNPGSPDSTGNPTPTTETSVCETTPGATCYIKFTSSSGQSTQLPSQTAGSDGSTSWYWDVRKDANLTKGEWQITAIASLNGQVKSTNDPTKLTIQ